MDNRAHDEAAASDDELLFDRDAAPAGAGMSPLEMDEPLTRARLPPPPRFSQFSRSKTQPIGSFSTPPPSQREMNPLRPGEVLAGRYRVERLAGRMGLGLVVHVRHEDLGQRLILKCLPPEACRYPDTVAGFLRGARAAMRLQSEHTTRTVDAGRLSSGAPYVVSEALPGCDLREVLRVRGAVTLSEAVDFVLQAAESLSEAHSYGLVHRNINLTTLFSTRRPDGSSLIKVQDFGVADALRADPLRASESSLDATVFGSNPMLELLACSSPEQLRNPLERDVRTDVWALGAVLHELLAGYPVYQADSMPALLAMIAADPPLPITSVRSDVPAGLEAVILRCLAKERSARFATVAELAVALKEFASPELRHSVDRITRTLGRGARSSAYPSHASALVHVGPVPSAPPPAAAPSTTTLSVPPLLWSTLLIALGLVGGTIAGALFATRSGLSQRTTEPVSIERRVLAAQPAPPPAPTPLTSPPESAPTTNLNPPAQTAARPRARVANKPKASNEARGDVATPTEAAPAPARKDASVPADKSSAEVEPPAVATGKDLFDSMR